MGILQTFDVSFSPARSEEPSLPDVVYNGFDIKSIEVENVYAAGGSTATVELVYTDDVKPGTVAQIAERDYQPNMEIRVTHTHHEPVNEQAPEPQNVSDVFPKSNLADLDFLETDTFGLEDIFGDDVVPDTINRVGSAVRSLKDANTPESVRQSRTKTKRATIFTGRPIRVVGKRDGVVEMKLIDNRLILNRNYVTLDTQKPDGVRPREIIIDLMNEELGLSTVDSKTYESMLLGQIDKSPRDDTYLVLSKDISEEPIQNTYGDEEPIPLFRVLSDIAYRRAVHFFIDRFNNFRFEIYPDEKHFIPTYVTEVDAGNEEDPSNVLVKSPFDDTGLDFFGANTSEQVSSLIDLDTDKEKRTIERTNIVSAEEADSHTLSAYVTDQLSRNYGTIKILGEPTISIYDGIILGTMPDLSPVQNGLYSSKVVRHIINGSDGYITEIELGESIPKMYNRVAKSNKKAAKRSQEIKLEQDWQWYFRQSRPLEPLKFGNISDDNPDT